MEVKEFTPNEATGQKTSDFKDELTDEVRLDSLDTSIIEEKEFAEKTFSKLIEAVKERYTSPASTLAKNPEQLREYLLHNEEIIDLCIKRGIEKGMSEKDLRLLEISAIIHDIAKADTPESVVKRKNLPKGSESVSNLVLAMHHNLATDETDTLLKKNPEILKHVLGDNYSEKEAAIATDVIKNAIRSHMGPHPGFMDFVLAGVNKELAKMGAGQIEHPFPEKGDSVSETLLAADMRSLAGRQGRKKVLSIRKVVPIFVSQDLALVEKYKAVGIDLKQGEAALLSGFDSAVQARNMLPDKGDREWLDRAIDESKVEPYNFGDEKITFDEAIRKREQFEELNK